MTDNGNRPFIVEDDQPSPVPKPLRKTSDSRNVTSQRKNTASNVVPPSGPQRRNQPSQSRNFASVSNHNEASFSSHPNVQNSRPISTSNGLTFQQQSRPQQQPQYQPIRPEQPVTSSSGTAHAGNSAFASAPEHASGNAVPFSGNSAPASASAPTPPVVFQCKYCFKIVCDSTAYIDGSSNSEGTEYIVVSAVAPKAVDILQDCFMSTSLFDQGSCYHPIQCAHCENTIGRFYTSTPPEFDYARNKFLFLADQIDFYLVADAPLRPETVSRSLRKLLNPDPNTTSQQFAMLEMLVMKMHQEQVGLLERVKYLEGIIRNSKQGQNGN